MSPKTSTRAILVDHFDSTLAIDRHNGPVLPRQYLIKYKRANSNNPQLPAKVKVM